MATDKITPELADKLAAAVERAGMSRTRLAEITGIPYSTLGRKLNGHVGTFPFEIYKIALALNIEPGSLLPEVFTTSHGVAA